MIENLFRLWSKHLPLNVLLINWLTNELILRHTLSCKLPRIQRTVRQHWIKNSKYDWFQNPVQVDLLNPHENHELSISAKTMHMCSTICLTGVLYSKEIILLAVEFSELPNSLKKLYGCKYIYKSDLAARMEWEIQCKRIINSVSAVENQLWEIMKSRQIKFHYYLLIWIPD